MSRTKSPEPTPTPPGTDTSEPSSGPLPSPSRSLLSRAHPLDLAIVAAFAALTFLLGCFPLKDVDFWWHLKTGDLIRQTGSIPSKDLYTYTVPDNAWIDLHWTYQLLLSYGYQWFGVPGLTIGKCVITTAAVLLLLLARRRDWPVGVAAVVWLPALVLMGGRMYVRPETISLLYLAAFLAILFRWERQPRLAWLLPFVQMLWVNAQGIFVLGPIVLVIALIAAFLQPDPARRPNFWRTAILATALTAVACFINPYGYRGALFPLELLFGTMADPIFKETIAELSSVAKLMRDTAGYPLFMVVLHFGVIVLGGLSFVLPIVWVALRRITTPTPAADASAKSSRKKNRNTPQPLAADDPAPPTWRLSLFRLLLYAVFTALGLQATRNSHQFAAVVGAVTAWNFAEWAYAMRATRTASASNRVIGRVVALAAVLLVFVGVASGAVYRLAEEGRTIGLGEEPVWFPHRAIEFAGQAGLPPRFLGFHIGHSALYIHRWGPERKVFVDPRLEVMKADQYKRYLGIQQAIGSEARGWSQQLDQAGRPVILTDHIYNARIGAMLMTSPDWICVFFDPVAAVFLHRDVAAQAGIPAFDPLAVHFGQTSDNTPAGFPERRAEAKEISNYVTRLQMLNRPDQARGLLQLGITRARQARELDPRDSSPWASEALLEYAREPVTEPIPRYRSPFDPLIDLSPARVTYLARQAVALDPSDKIALTILLTAFQTRSMDEEAEPPLARLASSRPRSPEQARTQVEYDRQLADMRARLSREQFAVERPANGAEAARTVDRLLVAGRVREAAAFLQAEFPPERSEWSRVDQLATLWLHLGEPARARQVLEAAPRPPRPALQASRIGFTYLAEGNDDQARAAFRRAIEQEPDLFEAHYGLARLELDAGQAQQALAASQLAQQTAPTDLARTAARRLTQLVEPYARPTN